MEKTDFRALQKIRLFKHSKLNFKQDYKIFKECLKIIKLFKAKNILIFIPLHYEPNLIKFRHILAYRKYSYYTFEKIWYQCFC